MKFHQPNTQPTSPPLTLVHNFGISGVPCDDVDGHGKAYGQRGQAAVLLVHSGQEHGEHQ